MPRRLQHRPAGGAGEPSDEGSALIVTVLVAGVLAIAATATVTSGVASVGESGALAARTSARLAAESGVNATYAAMARASSAGALPCGLSAQLQPGGSGPTGYATTVAYSGVSGCAPGSGALGGTTEPSAATITATGTAPGATVVMEAKVSFQAPSPFAALAGDALATPGFVELDSNATVGVGAGADVVAGSGFQCTNQVSVSGGVTSWATSMAANNINSQCSVAGTVLVAGSVEIGNQTSVGGNLEAVGGAIAMNGSAVVHGSSYAAGGITTNGADPGAPWSGPAPTMPVQPSFPTLSATNLGASAFSTRQWAVDAVSSTQCASFFGNLAPSPFSNALANTNNQNAGKPLVIDAPSCTARSIAGAFSVAQNTVVIVAGFSTAPYYDPTSGTTRPSQFLAAPGAGDVAFALVVPQSAATTSCTGSAQINLSYAQFGTAPAPGQDPGLSTLLYAPGQVQLNTNSYLSGQIVSGGACAGRQNPAGIDLTNSVQVAYSAGAAQWLASLPSGSSPGCLGHGGGQSSGASAVASLDSVVLLRD